MSKEKIIVSTKSSRNKIIFSILLLLIIAIVPVLVHTQWFTGPLVNAILLLTCIFVGPMEAVIFGLVPSLVAFSTGLLPFPLAPMIPFIMVANAIYVAIFYYIYKNNFLLAVLISSFVKFLFLHLTVSFLMGNFLEEKFLQKLALMMSWPQLATALFGGVIAYFIFKTKTKNVRKYSSKN